MLTLPGLDSRHTTHPHKEERIKKHNPVKYPNQKIFILRINDYVYYVPFIEDEEKIFLKTIIPSRKLSAEYLEGANDE